MERGFGPVALRGTVSATKSGRLKADTNFCSRVEAKRPIVCPSRSTQQAFTSQLHFRGGVLGIYRRNAEPELSLNLDCGCLAVTLRRGYFRASYCFQKKFAYARLNGSSARLSEPKTILVRFRTLVLVPCGQTR